jgi:hypothetical protein
MASPKNVGDQQVFVLSPDGTDYISSPGREAFRRREPAHESHAPRGSVPRARAARRSQSVSTDPELRDAAEELGGVYLILAGEGNLPLDDWAIPKTTSAYHKKNEPNLNSRLMNALRILYGEPPSWKTQTDYIEAYRTVKTKLRDAALTEASRTLTKQIKDLNDLGRRLSQEGMAERLHGIAEGVRIRVGGFVPSGTDVKRAEATHGAPDPEYDPKYWQLLNESFRARVKSALAVELSVAAPGPTPKFRKEATDLCKILSLHPEIIKILDYYAMSSRLGDRLVHTLLAQAVAATAEFDAKLRESDHVWRYPPLIALGIKGLGLTDVLGFPEYAVDIGLVMSRTRVEAFLSAAGSVIFAVGILLTGPLAVTGFALDAALTGVALTDLAVTGTSGYLTYLRESEQDIAAIGGEFRPDRIAKRSDYSGTVLAGSAAFLCGIAFVFSGARVIKSWRARTPGTPPPTTTPTKAARQRPTRTNTTGTEDKVLRRATTQRARFTDRDQGPFAGPRRSIRPQDDANQVREVKVSGTRRVPATETPTTITPQSTGSKATGSGNGSLGATAHPGTTATTKPLGGSSVADTSFTLTPRQRNFPTKVLTHETEKAVGKKLELATGLKAELQDSKAAEPLSKQIPKGDRAVPITKPVLLKEPVITDPRYPAAKDSLGSAKPDYLLLAPQQVEIFEVTMDSRFSIVPQESGLQLRGSAIALGDPHKQIQVRKTLDYLIRRYPDQSIIYNIQTIGEVPPEVINVLQSELSMARKLLAAEGGNGSVEFVVRAEQTFTISVP